MPLLNSILDHEVLGREFKKRLAEGLHLGELTALRRQVQHRFGEIPAWADEKLAGKSTTELEQLMDRLFEVQSIEQLLN